MTNKLIHLLAIIAMAISIQSCDSNGDSGTQTFTIDGYSRVHTLGDNNISNKKTRYEISTNLSKMEMTLKATCAIDGEEDVTLLFEDVALTFAPGTGLVFSTANATPVASDGKEYAVTNLHGTIASYLVPATSSTNTSIINMLQISYTVNGKYEVSATAHTSAADVPQLLYANCSTTASTDGIAPFTTSATQFRIDMTSATEADVTVLSAQFYDKMPQQTIVLPKVSVTTTSDGYILKADELTPTINGTTAAAYKIKGFRMVTTNNCQTASVAFTCSVNDRDYTVSASCQLIPVIKVDQDSDSDQDSGQDSNPTIPEH